MNKIISIKNLDYYYNDKIIINNISLDIFKDRIIALRGPNGAGKTTLLKLMYGLLEPSSGNIKRNYDTNVCTSMIFQNPKFLDRTVYFNLEHALFCKNIPKHARSNIIKSLFKKYSLEYLSDMHIRLLSGGELQLVSLLRSLVIQPDVIFYDEPTNNLDTYNTSLIFDIINNYISERKQVILVSHDSKFIDKLSCLSVYLENGSISNA
ncbi:MAG: ATP-binding cassette domain-containing protein [Gammaproteobacteria bacterium]